MQSLHEAKRLGLENIILGKGYIIPAKMWLAKPPQLTSQPQNRESKNSEQITGSVREHSIIRQSDECSLIVQLFLYLYIVCTTVQTQNHHNKTKKFQICMLHVLISKGAHFSMNWAQC